MTLETFLFLLLFSGICGFIGQAMVGYSRGGFLATVVVGFFGALLGTMLASYLGLPALFTISLGLFTFSVVWSILGTIMLMGIVNMFGRRYYAY